MWQTSQSSLQDALLEMTSTDALASPALVHVSPLWTCHQRFCVFRHIVFWYPFSLIVFISLFGIPQLAMNWSVESLFQLCFGLVANGTTVLVFRQSDGDWGTHPFFSWWYFRFYYPYYIHKQEYIRYEEARRKWAAAILTIRTTQNGPGTIERLISCDSVARTPVSGGLQARMFWLPDQKGSKCKTWLFNVWFVSCSVIFYIGIPLYHHFQYEGDFWDLLEYRIILVRLLNASVGWYSAHNLFYVLFACAYGFDWFSSVFQRFPEDHTITSSDSLRVWNHHFLVLQTALEQFCARCGLTILVLVGLAFLLTLITAITSLFGLLSARNAAWSYLLCSSVSLDLLMLFTLFKASGISAIQDIAISRLKWRKIQLFSQGDITRTVDDNAMQFSCSALNRQENVSTNEIVEAKLCANSFLHSPNLSPFQQLLCEIDHLVGDWNSVASIRGAKFGPIYFGRPLFLSLLFSALSIVPSIYSRIMS